MDSGTRITGGGSGYAAILAHAGGVLYGMELGSVTLKRIGFFCFPIKHSTHTANGIDTEVREVRNLKAIANRRWGQNLDKSRSIVPSGGQT